MRGSFVFLGPSLPHAEAAKVFDGTLLPPAGRGDLAALFADGDIPDAVGIVDGKFLHEFAVTPKEVMAALATGTRLYGSSSMGALRAAECHSFGMVGVGKVFDLYATGESDADDEVGITFDPETLAATSEPYVNMRFAMAHAVETGQVSEETATAALAVAKEMFFPYRTYANVATVLKRRIPEPDRATFIAYAASPTRPDQKRLDALDLLARMNADGGRHDRTAAAASRDAALVR